MKNNPRSRTFIFTCNNYTEEDEARLKALKYKYLVYGYEIAPKTGTPHLQGYVELRSATTQTALGKKLVRMYVDYKKGTQKEAMDYAKKCKDFYEDGQPNKQGKRTDIENIKHMVNNGKGMRDIIEVVTSYPQVRIAECYLKYKEKPRDWKPEVIWYYGATGTGKTKRAMQEMPEDRYVCMDTDRWWEGYDGHANVIIDDMRKDFCKFKRLLRLLDRYECQVECKGGSRQLRARKIIITSCYSPYEMYDTREDIHQLIRRIDKIEEVVSNSEASP